MKTVNGVEGVVLSRYYLYDKKFPLNFIFIEKDIVTEEYILSLVKQHNEQATNEYIAPLLEAEGGQTDLYRFFAEKYMFSVIPAILVGNCLYIKHVWDREFSRPLEMSSDTKCW